MQTESFGNGGYPQNGGFEVTKRSTDITVIWGEFMKYKFIILIIIFLLWGQVLAQEEILPVENRGYFSIGLCFQIWKNQRYYNPFIQMTFPVTIVLPMGNNFSMTISHTPALSHWTEERRIKGLSDTWIQGSYLFWSEKAMLNLGIGAPTGKTRLNKSEFELSQKLSRNIFRFRLPVYSQGLCGNGGLAFAFPINETLVFGLGGQFIYRYPYHPVEYEYEFMDSIMVMSEEYRPGNEISGHLGVDIGINENAKIMLDGMYSYYWPDLMKGKEIYGSGKRLLVNLGIFYQLTHRQFLWIHAKYRQKGKNALWQGISLTKEEIRTNGDQIEVDILAELFSFENGALSLLGDGRYYERNEQGIGGAIVFGGGLGAHIKFWENSKFDFHCKYLKGTLMDAIEYGIQGLEIFLGLKLGF